MHQLMPVRTERLLLGYTHLRTHQLLKLCAIAHSLLGWSSPSVMTELLSDPCCLRRRGRQKYSKEHKLSCAVKECTFGAVRRGQIIKPSVPPAPTAITTSASCFSQDSVFQTLQWDHYVVKSWLHIHTEFFKCQVTLLSLYFEITRYALKCPNSVNLQTDTQGISSNT